MVIGLIPGEHNKLQCVKRGDPTNGDMLTTTPTGMP